MAELPVCVYCRQRPVEDRWRPFCSERCRMADLGRWFTGNYRVPGPPVEVEPDAASEQDREPDDG